MPRAPIKALPPLEELQRLFSYCPETGVLTWKPSTHKGFNMSGKPAGTVTRRGYLTVGMHYPKLAYYLAHRIIWKLMTGDEPTHQVDHIDMDRLNNRWLNLRAATQSQNKSNGKLYKNNKSGVKGVSWDAWHRKWKVQISVDKKIVQLGRFNTVEEATNVVVSARVRLHGEFARQV
jgi:hypothetical protein